MAWVYEAVRSERAACDICKLPIRKSLKEEMTDRAFAAFRPPHRPARCRITLEHVQLRQIEDHLVLEAEAWKAE
jgi:hypothetical protein